MHPTASFALLASFTGLVAGVVAALLLIVHRAAVTAGRNAAHDTKRAAAILASWMLVTGGLGAAGVFADFSLPPKLPVLLVVSFALTIWLAASRYGAHLVRSVPLSVLVGINAFRLPLELLMNHAQKEGVMPIQMSYSGQNYDIVSGVLAIVVAALCTRRDPPLRLVRLFNIIGFALLLNILTIAVLSMPLPIRVYMNEPANTWVADFPFIWLPTVLVLTALLSHILILRRLVGVVSAGHYGRGTSR